MGKYIETALPLAEINDAAIREKAGKRGHPQTFICGGGAARKRPPSLLWLLL